MKNNLFCVIGLISLTACGESPTPTSQTSPRSSVFDGYVETRNVAQDTALGVQEAMQQQERSIEQLKQP